MSRATLQAQFTKMATPATPYTGEIGFIITVDGEVEWIPAQMPKVGDVYSDTPIQPKVNEALYGTYVCVDVRQAGQSWQFFFGKAKTGRERNTPYTTEYRTERYTWPPVLEWISWDEDSAFPLSQNGIDAAGNEALVTIPRWTVQYGLRDGQSLQTNVTVKHYLSEVPYPETQLISDEPQPAAINWDLPGNHGSTGPCLHGQYEIPIPKGVVSRSSVETQNPPSANSHAVTFEPTNHEDWQDITVMSMQRVGGQYYKTETIYHVPDYEPVVATVSS